MSTSSLHNSYCCISLIKLQVRPAQPDCISSYCVFSKVIFNYPAVYLLKDTETDEQKKNISAQLFSFCCCCLFLETHLQGLQLVEFRRGSN